MTDYLSEANDSSSVGAGHFNEEWFWVFGYGSAAVLVLVANIMLLFSIGKNEFLHTNTHRVLAVLATRNIVRSVFGLAVVYITRWCHPTKDWKYSEINSTKEGIPLICDILCAMETFLMTLPMFLLVGLSVHMFTRYANPQFEPQVIEQHNNSVSHAKYSAEYKRTMIQHEPTWLSVVLPILPILASCIVTIPVPLLHLTQPLQAVPEKMICSDPTSHLTFDLSVFMIGFVLPVLLMLFLMFGIFIRRCIQCSSGSCCNSWCKEEIVLFLLIVSSIAVYGLMYLPMLEAVSRKMDLSFFEWPPLAILKLWIKPEVGRGIEMLHGILLPFYSYLCLPAYRQFCSEPDPDDVRLNVIQGRKKHALTNDGAILVGVKSLDFVEEGDENESEV